MSTKNLSRDDKEIWSRLGNYDRVARSPFITSQDTTTQGKRRTNAMHNKRRLCVAFCDCTRAAVAAPARAQLPGFQENFHRYALDTASKTATTLRAHLAEQQNTASSAISRNLPVFLNFHAATVGLDPEWRGQKLLHSFARRPRKKQLTLRNFTALSAAGVRKCAPLVVASEIPQIPAHTNFYLGPAKARFLRVFLAVSHDARARSARRRIHATIAIPTLFLCFHFSNTLSKLFLAEICNLFDLAPTFDAVVKKCRSHRKTDDCQIAARRATMRAKNVDIRRGGGLCAVVSL